MKNLKKNAIVSGVPMTHIPRTGRIIIKGVYCMGTNDVDYRTQVYDTNGKQVWKCPYYTKWKDMLRRCYSPAFHNKYPTYKNCTTCDEWLLLSNFREWMVKQDWEGKDLDKDIIGRNGQYSPENCRFIDHDLNNLLTDHAAKRGDYPQGVSLRKQTGKYESQIKIHGKKKHLGYFLTAEEASKDYILAKRQYVLDCALNQEDVTLKNSLISIANDLAADTTSLLSERSRRNGLRERVGGSEIKNRRRRC